MEVRKRFQFSIWNFMWAVASVAMLCAVMKYTMPGKRIASAVFPLTAGIPVIAGSLWGGARGMCYGFCLGVALLIVVVGVLLLLMGLDLDIGAI